MLSSGNFYDLGSGVGKGLLAAAFTNCFTKVIGIEYLENLYELSLELKNKYIKSFNDDMNNHKELFEGYNHMPEMQIIHGDFLKEEWVKPSVILANSTCFSTELMTQLSKKAKAECPSGTIIVSFTKRIPDLGLDWELRDGFRRLMTWGIATIYIHRRK